MVDELTCRFSHPSLYDLVKMISRSLAYVSVEAVVEALRSTLKDDLLAVYLYGSLSDGTYQADQSDVNLLAVIDNPSAVHPIRQALRSGVWAEYGHVLRNAPLLATQSSLDRHMCLNPLLQTHFAKSGQLIFGQAISVVQAKHGSISEMLANAAAQAMRATAALAPSLLPPREAQESLASLRSLARRLFGWPVDADESPAVLAGRVLGFIHKRMVEESLSLWPDETIPNAPPLVSNLRAIYEMDSHLVLVMPDLDPVELARRVALADWHQIADRIGDQYRGLRVTTPSQLRLIVKHEDSTEYLVQGYRHAWGADPIGNLQIPLPNAFRGLARPPSELELAGLPHAYITAEDTDLSMLVHDFQNKLLNIQLRSELLCRTLNVEGSVPAEPLPERDVPETTRIDAILAHLRWWANHYTSLMQRAPVNPAEFG